MLGFLAEQGLIDAIEAIVFDALDHRGGGDLKGRAARESAAEGDRRAHHRFETVDFELSLLKPRNHAPNIVRPGRLSALQRTAQVERGGVARGDAVQNDLFVEAS